MSNQSNIFGLVLVGGKSKRMQTEKATLNYHGKEQFIHCFELLSLSTLCEKTFVSCRKEQAETKGLPQIYDLDEFTNIGPLGGILSAMKTYPQAAWLVLACDLPFVSQPTLTHLIENRDAKKIATAYKSVHNSLPEPLCAIYEPHAQGYLLDFLKEGIKCPRKILIKSDVALLEQNDNLALENINSPEEYKEAVSRIQRSDEN